MKALSERDLKSLVTLLDDEDPKSLDLVCRQILKVGEPVLPFLEEMRGKAQPEVAARADGLLRRLRFKGLKQDFLKLASAKAPDLEEGAWLVCRFGYPGLDLKPHRQWLNRVAARIQDELPSEADLTMTFQKLNRLLFKEMGFAGNHGNYYDPNNSYLNRVIETRRGIPLSLSVLYLLLCRRLRLPIYGVGLPGHFMLGFRSGQSVCFLDAFSRGRLMDAAEVRRMLLHNGYEMKPQYLEPASSRDILVRMMRNLISIYQKAGAEESAEMLSELAEVMLTIGPALNSDLPR